MQKPGVFLVLLFSAILAGCTLEEATAPTHRELVIASDYLNEEDSVLFAKFSRLNDIDIRIVHLDAQLIYKQLQNESAESEIDLIMLESEYNVHQLAVANLLQPWPKDFSLPKHLEKYASSRYRFVGFALDPYIITASKNSNPITTYNDLTYQPFSDELSEADRINLLAPICRKMDKGKTEIWINKFAASGYIPKSGQDSVLTSLPRLMKRSTYYQLEAQSPAEKMPSMRILSSGKYGSFYNLRTFCMAEQCSNYTEAICFARYFLKGSKNQYLSSKLHLVPATKPGKVFRPYKVGTGELLPFHTLVERILDRIGHD